ncbi:hypothetical protein THAOC_32230 [Thalassiosira oceanica]|uniref:Uncharacterized protein n=1 Tax=Thalassiosira oceanica TaxID=159749 RepID=K0RQE7_THAOC|nr:hypothetical protein THAOC_32230 [Thalassiosira oceanica]|eukprot:EJK48932.1 hypothetical protein THAOC_32230 [Thalassiosira oceanica]
MKGKFPDEPAAGRVTSVHQQERESADRPLPPARPSGSGDDTAAVDGGFNPTASEGREKDPRDDTSGKPAKTLSASTSSGSAFDERLQSIDERMESKVSSGGDATKPTISLSDDVESAPLTSSE